MEPTNEPNKPAKKGYGKRPLWQWIVLYIIVAIIVYGAGYLLFFHHAATGTSTGGYSY